MRGEPVSMPISGARARCSGCVLTARSRIGLLSSRMSLSSRIRSGSTRAGSDRGVRQRDLLDSRVFGDAAIEIEQFRPVGHKEWQAGLVGTPDEHVLRRQRNLLVAGGDVPRHRLHDFFLRYRNARIQVGLTECAAAAAPGRHLDDAEGRPRLWHDQGPGVVRVIGVEPGRQRFPDERPVKQFDDVTALGAAADNGVDTEVRVRIGLVNLPRARAAQDDGELVPRLRFLDGREHPPGINRVQRFLRRTEDRGVDAGGKRRPQGVVRRDRDDFGILPDEAGQLVRVAHCHLIRAEFTRQHGFEHAESRRRRPGAMVLCLGHVPPRRVFLVDYPLHPLRDGRQRHLDEKARVVDAFCQGSGQDNRYAALVGH